MAQLLVIEDDPTVCFSLKLALQSMGHKVDFAGGGAEGVEKCKSKTFELVITDLNMPDKDGLETTMDLKQAWPDLRVIVMSGDGQSETIDDRVKSSGATAYLAKPFSAEELESCILKALKD